MYNFQIFSHETNLYVLISKPALWNYKTSADKKKENFIHFEISRGGKYIISSTNSLDARFSNFRGFNSTVFSTYTALIYSGSYQKK